MQGQTDKTESPVRPSPPGQRPPEEESPTDIVNAETAPPGPKQWLSVAFNGALGSAFALLVFLALYVAANTWGWGDLGKFLLVVALLTLLEMRIIEPLTELLHLGGEPAHPRPEKRKARVQRAVLIALAFTVLMEAFNLTVGGEAFKAASEGKAVSQTAGLQFAFVAFFIAFFAVGTISFCWAWGASMRRRRASVLGLLAGIVVGVCFASFQGSAPEIMAALYQWLGLPAQDWSSLRMTRYEAFAQYVSVWAASGLFGGLFIDHEGPREDFNLLLFPFVTGVAAVISFAVLWVLINPVHWLLFRDSLHPYPNLQGYILSLVTDPQAWGVVVRNLGWGFGIAACAHSAKLFAPRPVA